MFRARWAALALSAGLLVTSSGCLGLRNWSRGHRLGECECMDPCATTPYGMPGVEESMVVTPPELGGLPPVSMPPVVMPPMMQQGPTTAPPPRVVPIPQAPPTSYAPAKFFRR